MTSKRGRLWRVLPALLPVLAWSAVAPPLRGETDGTSVDGASDARIERLREAIEREREALERERERRRSMEEELKGAREELERTREELEQLEREVDRDAATGD